MFTSIILKTIPRSWKAAVALLVMFLSSQQAFTGLQTVVLSGGQHTASFWDILKLVVGLIVALGSTAAFYYFQSRDAAAAKKSFNEVEYLNQYQEEQKKLEMLKHSATPVFSSLEGEIKPKPNVTTEAAGSTDLTNHNQNGGPTSGSVAL